MRILQRRRHAENGNGRAIGGFRIGEMGRGQYTGYRLTWGDDFNEVLSLQGPGNLFGKYSPVQLYKNGSTGTSRISQTTGGGVDVDPLWTGNLDANRGVPVGFSDMIYSASGRLNLKSRVATTAEQAAFSAGQAIASAMLHMGSAISARPPFIVDFSVAWVVPQALQGSIVQDWHPTVAAIAVSPSTTDSSVQAGFEAFAANIASFTGSISGTTLTITGTVAGATIVAGQTLNGTNVVPGTAILSGSGTSWQVTVSQTVASTAMTSFAGAGTQLVDYVYSIVPAISVQQLGIQQSNYVFDGTNHLVSFHVGVGYIEVWFNGLKKATVNADTTQNGLRNLTSIMANHVNAGNAALASDFAALGTAGAVLSVDYVRFWAASSGVHWKPQVTNLTYNFAYGQTGTIVLPSTQATWGPHADPVNGYDRIELLVGEAGLDPGGSGAGSSGIALSGITLPSGGLVTAANNVVTIGTTDLPGVARLVRHYSRAGGDTCEPQVIAVCIGPNVATANQTLNVAVGTQMVVDYYGYLQTGSLLPKSLSFGTLPSGVTAAGTQLTVNMASAGTTTFVLSGSNSLGQPLTQTISIVAATSWAPSALQTSGSGGTNVLVTAMSARNTASAVASGGTLTAFKDLYTPANQLYPLPAGGSFTAITVNTASGSGGTSRVLAFGTGGALSANNDGTTTGAFTALLNLLNGSLLTLKATVMFSGYLSSSNTSRIASWGQKLTGSNTSMQGLGFRNAPAGVYCGVGWEVAANGSSYSVQATTNQGGGWHVYAVTFNAGTITVYKDKVSIASGTVSNDFTTSFVANEFFIAGTTNNTTVGVPAGTNPPTYMADFLAVSDDISNTTNYGTNFANAWTYMGAGIGVSL